MTENIYYKMRWNSLYFDHSKYKDSKFLLTFIISLMRENLSKIFLTSLDRIYLLWRVTRVDRDIWNHKILHELLNLISLINEGSHLFFFPPTDLWKLLFFIFANQTTFNYQTWGKVGEICLNPENIEFYEVKKRFKVENITIPSWKIQNSISNEYLHTIMN